MALSTETKLSIAFKKLVGKDQSSNSKEWYEENDGGGFNVWAGNVFADTIPSTPPGSTSSVVKCYTDAADGAIKLTQDVTVGSYQGWYAEDGGRLRYFIPPSYGQGYTVKLYQDDGTGLAKGSQIFTTDAMDWFFDYDTGYLAIQDSHSYTTPFWIEIYHYVGDSILDQVGSLPTVFTGLTDTPSGYTTANAIYTANGTPDAVIETTVQLTEPGANQFTLTAGTSALAISTSCSIDQDLQQSATVQFAKVNYADVSTYINKDGSNNLSFTDAVAGTFTLNELASWVSFANTDVDTPSEVIDTFADTDCDGAVWHYIVKDVGGTNLVAGTIVACWVASTDTVEYHETKTNDLGDTSDVVFSVSISANQVQLVATVASSNWSITGKRMQIN